MSSKVTLPTQALDFKAFTALLAANHKGAETSDEAYLALFKSINKDNSGNVSSAELRTALQHFGNNALSEVNIKSFTPFNSVKKKLYVSSQQKTPTQMNVARFCHQVTLILIERLHVTLLTNEFL